MLHYKMVSSIRVHDLGPEEAITYHKYYDKCRRKGVDSGRKLSTCCKQINSWRLRGTISLITTSRELNEILGFWSVYSRAHMCAPV